MDTGIVAGVDQRAIELALKHVDALFGQNCKKLYGKARSYRWLNSDSAEDVVMEAYQSVRGVVSRTGSIVPLTYLTQAVRNRALDYQRAADRRREVRSVLLEKGDSLEETVADEVDGDIKTMGIEEILQEFLQEFPEECREILAHRGLGKKPTQISTELNIKRGTVASRISRALGSREDREAAERRLRELLGVS